VGDDRDTAQDRVTIQEAARRLGVKEDAIRKRIQRGTLRHEKTEEGRVFVWVAAPLAQDTTQDMTEDTAQDAYRDALVGELRERVAFLEGELQRKDAILLNMTEAMKAIAPPAPEEAPTEAPETATEQPGRVEPQPAVEGAQEPLEPRSWWRRMFGS
jgi:excisionase family DNA binding protein